MERFLLFDSGCSLCTQLAHSIERETDGRLQARSLREPEVKALLDRAQPNWRWEPTLLEAEDDRLRAFTGLAMRARLLWVLGPRRTWGVAKAVRAMGVPLVDFGLGRREFLRRGATLLAGLLLWPFGGRQPAGPPAPPDPDPQEGTKHPFQRLRIRTSTRLEGARGRAWTERALKSPDLSNIRAQIPFEASEAIVYRHDLMDGNTLWAVGRPVSADGFVLYQTLARPVGGIQSQAFYYTIQGETASLQAGSVNGRNIRVPSKDSATIQSDCDNCDGVNFTFDCNGCVSINWGCVIAFCGTTCYPVCIGAGPLAWACLLACCGLGIYGCCDYWGTTCCSCF